MSDIVNETELQELKFMFDNDLRGEYGIDHKHFIFKLDHFRYDEIKLTKRKGFFNKERVETGEIGYKILAVYFHAPDIVKGMIGSWDHFYLYSRPKEFFDKLISQVKDFKEFSEGLKKINLELTVKS